MIIKRFRTVGPYSIIDNIKDEKCISCMKFPNGTWGVWERNKVGYWLNSKDVEKFIQSFFS